MKRLLLTALAVFTFGVSAPRAGAAGVHDDPTSCAECDCPKDCDCRKPGGTCPVSGPCECDCPCKKSPYIHPSVQKAIERTELKMAHGTQGADDSDWVTIRGQQFPTGFKPTREIYRNAKFKNVSIFDGKGLAELPEEFDMRKFTFSPVRSQWRSDCWAQATTGCMEANVNAAEQSKKTLAVQQTILCSNNGTAGGGGNLSLDMYKKLGAVYESELPYTAKDGRCPEMAGHEKADDTFFARGQSGKFPTIQEFMVSMYQDGAHGVCGSASALGEGGRQDEIRGGNTNHCYVAMGWLSGKLHGWLDAIYIIIKNSWGPEQVMKALLAMFDFNAAARSWGDQGYGYYPLAKADGVHMKGTVITEIQGMKYAKPIRPPQDPIIFDLKVKGAKLRITIPSKAVAAKPKATLSENLTAAFAD